MKRIWIALMIATGVIASAGSATPLSLDRVTDFTGWSESQWKPELPVAFSVDGGTVALSGVSVLAESQGTLAKRFTGTVGMGALVHVSNLEGTAAVGLRRYLGKTRGGTLIQAEMWIESWQRSKRVMFRVRERMEGSETVVRQLASGVLGEWDGSVKEGETYGLAFALVEGEIWFYATHANALLKCPLLTDMTAMDADSEIFGWVSKGILDQLRAEITHLWIIYP